MFLSSCLAVGTFLQHWMTPLVNHDCPNANDIVDKRGKGLRSCDIGTLSTVPC